MLNLEICKPHYWQPRRAAQAPEVCFRFFFFALSDGEVISETAAPRLSSRNLSFSAQFRNRNSKCTLLCIMMTPKGIEDAFQRHPRPQNVPTKAALLQKSLQKSVSALTSTSSAPSISITRKSPWKDLRVQGDLVQGKYVWTVCLASDKLVMVKKVTPEGGKGEFERTSLLSPHLNVASLKQCFEMEDIWYMEYDYSRFTLEEVLNVHMRLEESHIRIIASSVTFEETFTLTTLLMRARLTIADVFGNTAHSKRGNRSHSDLCHNDPVL